MCILCAHSLNRAQPDNTENGAIRTSANTGFSRKPPKAVDEGISVLSGGEELRSLHLIWVDPADQVEQQPPLPR